MHQFQPTRTSGGPPNWRAASKFPCKLPCKLPCWAVRLLAAWGFFFSAFSANAQDTLHQIQLPHRIYGDTAHAPFYHGVASGDPDHQSVLLWTRWTPTHQAPQPDTTWLYWQLSTTPEFSDILQQGYTPAPRQRSWTVHHLAQGLEPHTRYYYRFQDTSQGLWSAVGRTQTTPAPGQAVQQARVGVVSCSSVFSGYFNAYARLAERQDLDLVIHLGDYTYNYVDRNQPNRLTVPYPPKSGPDSTDWHARHAYYLLDPDLRAARQQHPWFVLWDNHDLRRDNDTTLRQTARVFQDWVPIRRPAGRAPHQVYRSLQFGALAEFYLLDILLHKDPKTQPKATRSMLGRKQKTWLYSKLDQNETRWRVLGNQKIFTNWRLAGRDVVGSSWDHWPADRRELLDYFRQRGWVDNLVLSGDEHIFFAMDLTDTPRDPSRYDWRSGAGAVGAEFLPGSVSRVNLDERAPFFRGGGMLPEWLSLYFNPHHRATEFVNHGYGLLDITPERIVAEFWAVPHLEVTTAQYLHHSLLLERGQGHWERAPRMAPQLQYLPGLSLLQTWGRVWLTGEK